MHFVQANGKVAKRRQLINFLHDLAYFDNTINMEKLVKFTKISTNDFARILVNISNNMNARIVTPQNESFEMHPILTEVGLCYTFNSRVGHLFNPVKDVSDARQQRDINLYKINFYDSETEATLMYTYTGSNFDVS